MKNLKWAYYNFGIEYRKILFTSSFTGRGVVQEGNRDYLPVPVPENNSYSRQTGILFVRKNTEK